MREQTHEHMERLRDAAARALTEEDVRQIFQNLADRAKKGDREAIRLVMAYLTPPPPQVKILPEKKPVARPRLVRKVIDHDQAESA